MLEVHLPDQILAVLSQARTLHGQRLPRGGSGGTKAAGDGDTGKHRQRHESEPDQQRSRLERCTSHSPCTIDSGAVPVDSVCIVGGTGALGFGLALRLGRAGVPVVIGSRDSGRAQESAGHASEKVPEGSFTGLENNEAVAQAELIILSVPFRSQSENLGNLKHALKPGQLLIDATVPLAAAVGGKATRTLAVWQGSAAQQAQEMVPDGVTVVSAFHTVSAALLTDLDHELDEDVLICGDRREDKAKVAELVQAIDGLRPVDCGPLELARIVEQLTPLIISINVRNKVRAGIKITGLASS
jgi:NADPH-dependent F420 reductase